MGKQDWDATESYNIHHSSQTKRPGWARIRDKLQAELTERPISSFIEATSEEIDQAQGMIAREKDIDVESVTWCMHCGRSLMQSRVPGHIQVIHPVWQDLHGNPHSSQTLELELSEYKDAQELVLTIGRWIRERVHPAGPIPVPGRRIPYAHEPVAVYDSPPPEFTETMPDPHLLESIKPLMGPHLEAITQVMHLTEAIGPMQQWSATGEEDCGFQVEITIRVIKTGGCFDNVRERRHMGTAMRVPVQGHEDHGHPSHHEVPDRDQESTGQREDSSLGDSEGDG